MKATEDMLKKKWSLELLNYLRPHVHWIPELQKRVAWDNSEQHMLDLFGDWRWGRVRTLVGCLKAARKAFPTIIPWTEEKVSYMLQHLENSGAAAAKPLRILSALNALGARLGIPEVKLMAKARAIRGRLAVVTAVVSRRALEPSIEALAALEKAGMEAKNPVRAYTYLHFRWLAGCSGRYDDGQHTREDSLIDNATSFTFLAWQTKTSCSLENPTKVLPLSCPKRSLSGAQWWVVYLGLHLRLRKTKELAKRDHLLPRMTRHGMGFTPKPMPRAQALRLFRDALVEGGVQQETARALTLPSLRVFAPSRAYRAGVDRTRRSALGRWEAEMTADVYVREHCITVEQVWDEFLAKAQQSTPDGGGWTQPPQEPVATEIGGPAYFPADALPTIPWPQEEGDSPPGLDTAPWVCAQGLVMESVAEEVQNTLAACSECCTFPDHVGILEGDATCVRGEEPHWMHICSACFQPRMNYKAYDEAISGIGHVEDPRIPFPEAQTTTTGPLRLGINTKGAIDRAHLFMGDFRGVGCHWKVAESRINWVADLEDWTKKSGIQLSLCAKCFRAYRLPDSWKEPGTTTQSVEDLVPDSSEDGDSSSSDSSSGADSDGALVVPDP